MIVNERFTAYSNSLDRGNTQLLDEIETEALRTDVPVIRKETQICLKLFLALKKPASINIRSKVPHSCGSTSAASPSTNVMESSMPARLKFARAIGIRFS